MCWRKLFTPEVNKKEAIKWGIRGAMAEIFYCLLIILFFYLVDRCSIIQPSSLIWAFIMLVLLVFSVALSGIFIFGYPSYLVLQQKRYLDALATAFITLATLVILIFLFILLYLIIF